MDCSVFSSEETITLYNGLVTWAYNWDRRASMESTVLIVVQL